MWASQVVDAKYTGPLFFPLSPIKKKSWAGNARLTSNAHHAYNYSSRGGLYTECRAGIGVHLNSLIFFYSFTGCCWISLVTGGSGWEVRVKANIAVRADGRINSSPIVSIEPIIRLQQGFDQVLHIQGELL